MWLMPLSEEMLFHAIIILAMSSFVEGYHNDTALATSQIMNDPFPYNFPQQDQSHVDLFPMRLCNGLDLEEATIDQLQHRLSSGKLSTQDLARCYIDRITQTDGYIR